MTLRRRRASPCMTPFRYSGTTYGWLGVGGTSAGAPQWAALIAIADQGRAASGQPAINSTSPQEVMSVLYKNPGDFHDITVGTSIGQPHYSAGIGYDYVTGLGSPIANLVVGSFVGTSTTAPPDTLVLAATTDRDGGRLVQSHRHRAELERGDRHRLSGHSPLHERRCPGQPAGELYLYRSRPRNAHVHGHAEDRRRPVVHGDGYDDIRGERHAFSGSPSARRPRAGSSCPDFPRPRPSGVAQTVTVTANDPYGNVATGYTGTVQFTSSDAAASLPANYTFTTADHGVHSLRVHVRDRRHAVAERDRHHCAIHRQPVGNHGCAGSPRPTWSPARSRRAQINLTWTGSNGATGYLIQQSTGGTHGWTQVGSTSGGSNTTFQQTGLSAGTTYYYPCARDLRKHRFEL